MILKTVKKLRFRDRVCHVSTFSLLFILIVSLISCFQKQKMENFDGEKIVPKIASKVNNNLKKIKIENEKLAKIFTNFYKNNAKAIYPEKIYYRNISGIYGDHDHISDSTLYVNIHTKITPHIKKFMRTAEHMEPYWDKLFKNYPLIGWLYIIDRKTSALRLFPWVDVTLVYGNNQTFHFDSKQEKESFRKTKWTEPTTDLTGLGWITSIFTPIFLNEHFIGAQMIDIPIYKIVNTYINPVIKSYNNLLFIIAQNNTIITRTESDFFYIQDKQIKKKYDNYFSLVNLIKAGKINFSKKYEKKVIDKLSLTIYSAYVKENDWNILIIDQDS